MMRLLGFIVFTVLFLERCCCAKASSMKHRSPETYYSHASFATARPRNADQKPMRTRNLMIASEVFETLGNCTENSFASTFVNIGQQKLLTALRGVSIVVRVTATQFDENSAVTLDRNSTNLANSIKKNLEKIAEKLYSPANLYFNSMTNLTYQNALKAFEIEIVDQAKRAMAAAEFLDDQSRYNMGVMDGMVPINKTSFSMIQYMLSNNYDNRDDFTKDYREAKMEQAIDDIIQMTLFVLHTRTNISGSHKDLSKELRNNMTRFFFQACIIQYFQIGVEYRRNPNFEDIKLQEAYFKIRLQHFKKILKEASRNSTNSISPPLNAPFPGTIQDDIVRPLIDVILEKLGQNMSNCLIAENIKDRLDKAYPKDKFYIIVFNTTSKANQYAYHGFPQRTLIDHYNGKTVLIFKATEKAIENKIQHYDIDVLNFITQATFDVRDLNTGLTYAISENKGYQMGVFSDELKACYCPVDSTFADEFAKMANGKRFGIVIVF